MFRFTIRDLMWLTLVVAVALGWFVRERQLGDEVGRRDGVIGQWQQTAVDLNYMLQITGWQVTINPQSFKVDLYELAEPTAPRKGETSRQRGR